MQPKHSISRIARKEIALFFSAPIAYLFLAAFAGITLFTFFWGEAFFARNIADVRPLFEWMPLLLIFLASTLTMRLWSEERRTGTLEHILTQPVPLWHFVVGKFLGCLTLLVIALLMTLPLPITVSILGDLDWGPVWAGYLATLLLGAAYLSIGLFVSSRSDNQIVSLISAVALSGIFYLLGSKAITDFFGNSAGEWLRLLGTGSRFESITRGVIDLRDLYYYISLILVFLALNTFSLERERWAASGDKQHHQHWRLVTALLLVNALGANLWLGQINSLRVDATEGKQYSISPATQQYLAQLQEPLLIRGYFSGKTHPLLSPLVPQLRDLMKEYEIESRGKVRVEFIDPVAHPELEEEANQKYAIQPVPFQVADRYQAAVVNSYFNVLVQYGDEYQVLGFRDLIEVKSSADMDIDVKLRNPEHDLTRAIKKVLHSYQAGGNLFDTVKGELVFNAYVSADEALPQQLRDFKNILRSETEKQQQKANGRLQVNFLDPDAEGGKLGEQIANDYGFKPMATSLLSNERFYFYMTLAQGDQIVQIPLDDLSSASFERNLAAAVKRFATGFTKTLAWVGSAPAYDPHGMGHGGTQFNQLEQFLSAELNIQREDLSDGRVSGQADILFLAAPKALDEKQLFAVDQFLMQGGTVIAATSPYAVNMSQRSLSLQRQESGLDDWLKHHGIGIESKLVMDKQNVPFPVPVTRNLGGFSVQEMRMLDYPYFVDVRGAGLNADNAITANLPQITLAWASPILIDAEKQKTRTVIELLRSSDKSWLSSSMNIVPQITEGSLTRYLPEGEQKKHLLGAVVQGRFESFFAGKESPLLKKAEDSSAPDSEHAEQNASESRATISSVIAHSPDSARIILFSSNDFIGDPVVSMAGAASGGQYLGSLQLMANTFDWALEDEGLLSIRARSNFNRTLPAMEESTRVFWEYLNYGLALLALLLVGLVQHQFKRAREKRYQQWMAT
ncbi:Gldg family protein [Cellvibrio japonicus]|uniref:Putative membrane protein n=1 Tax=Cellvibrio japonicus (strain Ueda107) TaxID=498211 RepID=B3PBN1_CELJU|nr:Gldg family protein [Cellvibrio japonicus]ACE84699.1 putative membrane protein [Cellvibrio japonicus Ueda107]QEI11705.1 ABC transporter permease subunit [Cellvibrio japonicus]QEI15279.1 ABC transporter permease subunit [Cellvibrio japonicus]QEI18859.1 ABC transporter permease subunit [Cellvibrio japonicus]